MLLMQLNLRPIYNLLRQQINFEWILEYQKGFDETIPLLTELTSNKTPDSYRQLYAMCEAFSIGIFAALFPSHQGTNKMNLIPANSNFLHKQYSDFQLS